MLEEPVNRGPGRQNHIVLVLTEGRRALALQYAHHLKRHAPDAYHLTDDIFLGFIREKIINHSAPNNTILDRIINIGFGKEFAHGNSLASDGQVIQSDALQAGTPVLVLIDDLSAGPDHRRNGQNSRAFLGDGFTILDGQGGFGAPAKMDSPGLGAARENHQDIVAHAFYLLFYHGRSALADRNNGNHRGNPNDDADDGQGGPAL